MFFFPQANLKGSSSKPVPKRVEVKAGSNLAGIPNTGIKNLVSQASAAISSHLTLTNESKGGEVFQDKTGSVFFLLLYIRYNVEDRRNISCFDCYDRKITLSEGHLFQRRNVYTCTSVPSSLYLAAFIGQALRLWDTNQVLV